MRMQRKKLDLDPHTGTSTCKESGSAELELRTDGIVPGFRKGGDVIWPGGGRGSGRGGDSDWKQVQVRSRLQHKEDDN
jgi:hypothetical protein